MAAPRPTPSALSPDPRGARVPSQPTTEGMNFYESDASLRALLHLYLPPEELDHVAPVLARLGALVGAHLDRLARSADRNPPSLEHRDRQGGDSQRIERHPDHREMERLAFAEFEMAAVSHRPALGWPRVLHPAVKYALTYLFAQSEFGLLCPVNMTDSLTRTIRRHASPELVERYLEGLLAGDLDALTQGAMFMTEKYAGSDVGATEVRAERDGDAWTLHGEKWFCSNPDAGLALVLARPRGAPAGLRGLSLFLLPRVLPGGEQNAHRIVRLKDKLGSRSMASGEIVLEGARAWLVGEPGEGFRQIAEMVNQSRLSNGVRAAGLMRRACHEALAVARGRAAFGGPLVDKPLMRRQLLKLLLPAEAALSMVFYTADSLHAADAGDAGAARRRRILTPLVKLRACRDARTVCGDAMEVRGGCGYIEEWIEARLVRDSHLGSIWEGTSNIIALDVVRAARRDECQAALGEDLAARLDACAEVPAPLAARLRSALEGAVGFVGEVAHEPRLEADARCAAAALYHATAAVVLATDAARLARAGADARGMLWAHLLLAERLEERAPLAPRDPAREGALCDALLADAPVDLATAARLVAASP